MSQQIVPTSDFAIQNPWISPSLFNSCLLPNPSPNMSYFTLKLFVKSIRCLPLYHHHLSSHHHLFLGGLLPPVCSASLCPCPSHLIFTSEGTLQSANVIILPSCCSFLCFQDTEFANMASPSLQHLLFSHPSSSSPSAAVTVNSLSLLTAWTLFPLPPMVRKLCPILFT